MLLATCVALGAGQASAQTAMVNPDPLAPNLQTDPRKPPRFQNSLPPLAQAGQPTTFAPFTLLAPASGAGNMGFDSTNARKKTKAKPKANDRFHHGAASSRATAAIAVSDAAPQRRNRAFRRGECRVCRRTARHAAGRADRRDPPAEKA